MAWDNSYPVRARILDVTGETMHGFGLKTPPVSMPHVGEIGLAERVGNDVRITLDSGKVLWGYECWWAPMPSVE